MPELPLSVVICTHNPRPDFLRRTLEALSKQTYPPGRWELLLVDNASTPALAPPPILQQHPAGRILREEELGLTAARLRGIGEAAAPLIVFVDDDNLLAEDYLEKAAARAEGWPMLGVWGCGRFTPEWEEPPAPALKPYLSYLAVNAAERDRWSNQRFDYAATPAGAGLCVRTDLARCYAAEVARDSRRKLLGRTGANLSGCEDFDLAFTAIDKGLGTGVFMDLALVHLMPRQRVEESYLVRLVEGHACSTVMLHALRDPGFTRPAPGLGARLREFRLRRALTGADRKMHDARRRGERRAWELLEKIR